MSTNQREIIKIVESFGLKVVDMVKNNHWKVRVARDDGTEETVIFSGSSSDRRTVKNKATQLRRIANGGSAR